MRKHRALMNCVGQGQSSHDGLSTSFSRINYSNDMAVSADEVKMACARLKLGKARGPDGLFPESYKYAGDGIIILISLLLTSCFIHGHLPQTMIDSIVMPIVKNCNGDVTDYDNYRGLALAPANSKILEFIILERYCSLLSTSANQFGFKDRHGTEECIFSLKEVINYYFDHNTTVFACFVDFSKAFDRVEHCRLFQKLIRRGIPLFIIRILSYWYSFQCLAVRWGNCISISYTVSNGVRQGGILSPFLFNCYTDEMSCLLTNSNIGCHIEDFCVNHLMYADDLVLLSASVIGLQKLLDICGVYCSEHSLLFNVIKTKCVYFCNVKPAVTFGSISLNDTIVEVQNRFKYLGHVITADLNDDYDIESQLRCFYGRGNMIVRKFKTCSPTIKVLLFKTFCGTIYCNSLWSTYTDKIMKRFQIAYNNMFRKLFSLPYDCSASEMFAVNHVPAYVHIRRTAMHSLSVRLQASNNEVLLRICGLSHTHEHKSPFWHVHDFLLYANRACRCAGCAEH